MATTRVRRLLACLAVLLVLAVVGPHAAVAAREYAAIFSFGDSLSDTGNLCVDGIPDYLATARRPYGMTYFGYPTGRVSDGRVIVDFIAQELGVPLLPPSRARNASFHRGANFAITGATALDAAFFQERGLGQGVWSSGSLHAQIKWFLEMKPAICGAPEACRELFRRSLFILGEFGGNDYSTPLCAKRPVSEAHALVPHVVRAIGEGVEKLIAEGAAELLVPGLLPIGCFPVYLTTTKQQKQQQPPDGDGSSYGRRSGCIKDLNTLSWVHNVALQRRIAELRARHPGVRIMYADYYTPAIRFVLHAEEYGFLKQAPRACCGAPGMGEHNYNIAFMCGQPGSHACDHPSNHWSWDGIHLTEAANAHIAKGWLYGPFADPPILNASESTT
ncbi:hypothetical protein U9M48_021222 [Paspalum notatum var. saurae]|uniref:GDSL esterase/lipase n=1 Tax=Paspalum notatum var. saurae TaxID=547442 RepID=A0AAQ3WTE9_PASNO